MLPPIVMVIKSAKSSIEIVRLLQILVVPYLPAGTKFTLSAESSTNNVCDAYS
jgi:hypothetical protein